MSMQALVFNSPSDATPISVQTVPIPSADQGSAVLKILATNLSPNARKVYSGNFGVPIPPAPFTLSAPAVGRIHAVGPDTTTLKPGQLVFFDFLLRARDNPGTALAQGYISAPGDGYDALAGAWKEGTMAQYAKVPLENVAPLSERLLDDQTSGLGRPSAGLGYTPADLVQMADCAVATQALLHGQVRSGSTVIIAPSTGRFSGTAVQVALAFGARVIAGGRTASSLAKLSARYAKSYPAGRLVPVVITGDTAADSKALRLAAGGRAEGEHGGADVFVDVSPTGAAVTHISSCIQALRFQGRVVFMGGVSEEVGVPYLWMMRKHVSLVGSHMFGHDALMLTARLVEDGHLRVGGKHEGENGELGGFKVKRGFGLTQLEEAYKANEECLGFGNMVVVEPWA